MSSQAITDNMCCDTIIMHIRDKGGMESQDMYAKRIKVSNSLESNVISLAHHHQYSHAHNLGLRHLLEHPKASQ